MNIIRLYVSMIPTCLLYINCVAMDPIKEFKKDIHHARHDIGAVVGLVAPVIGEAIRGELPAAIEKNPYKDKPAYVRLGSDLSNGEKEYLMQRFLINKAATEKLIKRDLLDYQVPRIAMVHSGGGYRAMNCTIGSLAGAEKMGLLDTTTYVTGLSGSTWAIGPWVSTQMPLSKFKEYIKKCASKPFTHLTDKAELLIYDAAAVKTHFKQERTPVDLYGDLLGNRLLKHFGDNRHTIYLSGQADIIQDGSYPYPIYTAIDADEHIIKNQDWYEFTPHEIGNKEYYIPAWAFGRKFEKGKSDKDGHDIYPPEKPLGYSMGMCGSAFGANIKTIKKEIAKTLGYENFLEHLLTSLDGERLFDFYAKVPNYAYKLDTHEKKDSKIKSFVDAGTDFNLPIPPLARRNVDVMIICDASAGKIGNELEKAAAYMEKHELPFPKIDYRNIDKKTISIFKEEDPNVPVVIYLPRISDKELWEQHKSNPQFADYDLSGFDLDHETNHGFAETIHFQYTPENTQKVMDQTEFNIRVNEAKIIKAIEFAVNRKKQQ